jgi:hypothetical protein
MALRHKQVDKCCVGATALFFFYRFHILNEDWPAFDHPSGPTYWYRTKLLSLENDPFKSPTPQNHIKVCKRTFDEAKCVVLKGKGTHIGRKEGCKLADLLDVPDAQLRRLGRWEHSQMVENYTSKLPQQAARILAGHGHEPGNLNPEYFNYFSFIQGPKLIILYRKLLLGA